MVLPNDCLSFILGKRKKKNKKQNTFLGKINPSYYCCLLPRGFHHISYSTAIETAALGLGTFEGVKASAWERENPGESQGSRQLPELDLMLIDEI